MIFFKLFFLGESVIILLSLEDRSDYLFDFLLR